MSDAPKEPGRIVTFYSYKGGTGRSMALANVAWIIASNGYRVLVVDWDLEAPGLHRYFAPFLLDPDLVESDGVIDIVSNYVTALMTPPASAPAASESDPPTGAASEFADAAPESSASGEEAAAQRLHEPYANVLRYATSLTWRFSKHEDRQGWIDFVPAGRQGASYGSRMNAFSWVNFYDRLGGGGFIEALKNRMKAEYDYVLIDSRTGVSDTSGVCTVQLPDVLAVCFTLNRQSIEGAGSVAASVQAARPNGSAEPLRIFPIPTRVEKAEKEKLDLARDAAADQFAPVLEHVDQSKWKQYWGDVEVLYEPFYAYEEVLATFRDPLGNLTSMLASMERVTSWLTDGRVTRLVPTEEGERQRVLAKYTRQSRKTRGRGAASGDAELQYYISYARSDLDESLERFFGDLESEVRALTGASASARAGFVDLDIAAGTDWQQQLESAIQRSRVLVSVYSPAYFTSDNTGREFEHFVTRAAPSQTAILPVIWVQPPSFPMSARQITYTSSSFPEEYKNLGLRSLMRLRRYEDTYQVFLKAYAQRLVELARQVRVPAVSMPPLASTPSAFSDVGVPSSQEREHMQAPEPSRRLDTAESVEAFAQSIPTLDRQALEEACENDLVPFLETQQSHIATPLIVGILRTLTRQHLFSVVEQVVGALRDNQRSHEIQFLLVEALLIQGRSGEAQQILRTIQLNELAPGQQLTMHELVGDTSKRLYVESGTPLLPVSRQNIVRAIRAYKDANTLSPKSLWYGINIAALLQRAYSDKVPVPNEFYVDGAGPLQNPGEAAMRICKNLLEKVDERVGNADATFWDFAVAAQAALAMIPPDDITGWVASSVRETDDAFDLSSLLYQLTEVWRLDGSSDAGRYALPLLCASVLKRDQGGFSLSTAEAKNHLSALTNIDAAFFKLVGAESTDALGWYLNAIQHTRHLVQIEWRDGGPRGSGVLVRGTDLRPEWGNELFLVTSTSVLAPVLDGASDVSRPPPMLSLGIEGMGNNLGGIVFTSPPYELDVTVVRLQFGYFAPGASPPVPAKRAAYPDGRNRAYVIGYPSDRPTLSMTSHQVLDRDVARIHLSTPAVPAAGGIGSPVFNREWELLGIVRTEGQRVRKLNGKEGEYRATEVTWIGAIKDALAVANQPAP